MNLSEEDDKDDDDDNSDDDDDDDDDDGNGVLELALRCVDPLLRTTPTHAGTGPVSIWYAVLVESSPAVMIKRSVRGSLHNSLPDSVFPFSSSDPFSFSLFPFLSFTCFFPRYFVSFKNI